MTQEKEKTKGKFSKYQLFVVILLAVLQFTVILDFVIISPLGDVLIKDLDISTAQFGNIVSAYAFSAGTAGLLTAAFADKFDRKKLLFLFYTGFMLGTLMCGLANSYETLLVGRIIAGLFGGVISSISLAIVTDLFETNLRGRVMGYIQMAFAVSQVIGIPFGIFIANHWGWGSTFIMIVALSLLVISAIALKLKPINKHLLVKNYENPFRHLLNTVTNKRYQVGFMATSLIAIGGFMLMPFGSAFMVNNIHISHEELPLVFMATGISSLIIMPIVGKLSDKFDRFKIFTVSSVVAIIMVIVYTNLSITPLWILIVINMILFVGIMGRSIPATALNTSIPELSDRGSYMSITSSLQQMAGGISAIIAGIIVHQETKTSPLEHFDTLGYIVSVVILLCIFLIYRVDKMLKTKTK